MATMSEGTLSHSESIPRESEGSEGNKLAAWESLCLSTEMIQSDLISTSR